MKAGQHIPALTIGLPVFNGESYLRESIESLINQSFKDFELVISNNASTDGTHEIIQEFQRRDPRIRYVQQPQNIGPLKNWLYVLQEAKSELFMWASHDDIWAPNWVEILIGNITQEDIGIRGKLFLMRDGSVIAEKTPPNFRKGDFVRCFLGNENNYRSHYAYSLFNCAKLRSTNLESIYLDYYPDAIFVYCLLEKGDLRTIPETHLCYRLHDQNLGGVYSRRWKGWQKIFYRIHPLRYYLYYIRYSKSPFTKCALFFLMPIKHIYSQTSFWIRGFREIITGNPQV